MPGIVVFGRRWVIGSDDFVIPFGIAFFLRVIWMLSLAIFLVLYHSFDYYEDDDAGGLSENDYLRQECQSTFDYFTSGYIVILFATNLLEFLVSLISSRGTIMDDSPRQYIPIILYVRLCFSVTEIFWLSLGVKWIFVDGVECPQSPSWKISKGVVIFNWMFLIFVALLVFCSFDSAGKDWVRMVKHLRTDKFESIRMEISTRYMDRWEGCFQCCCVCAGVKQDLQEQSIFAFIGMTLSEFFQDLDIVPSDIAAGLVLLRKLQKREENRQIFRSLSISSPTVTNKRIISSRSFQKTRTAKAFAYENHDERALFENVVHYSHYAVAAYGWPVYLLTDLKCGCCSLMDSMRCCYTCREENRAFGPVLEDNCCQCNFSAIQQTLGDFFQNVDIVYTSFVDELYVSPFFVAVDHEKKSVIVSIRGTLSLQNILTDFTVEPEKIPCRQGEAFTEWFAHKGMLRTALSVKDVLENKGILTEAFNRCPENERDNYKLIVVGHSLGAGAASVLAILLRDKYPNLFCYAFSPPGATLSYDATKYAENFTLSVIVGKDMIPRLSLNNLKDLRDRVMFIISRTRTPKWKILRGCVLRTTICCCCGRRQGDPLKETDIGYIEKKFNDFARQSSNTPDFYLPGKVLHLAKVKSMKGPCLNKQKVFEPFWSSSEDFNEILISSLMWADHMPDFVLQVLKDTFMYWSNGDDCDSFHSLCPLHDHDTDPRISENDSSYVSVLDSPTGAIVLQPGVDDPTYV